MSHAIQKFKTKKILRYKSLNVVLLEILNFLQFLGSHIIKGIASELVQETTYNWPPNDEVPSNVCSSHFSY